MSEKIDCIHLEGEHGCKLQKGSCGWNGEYCGLVIFRDDCEHRVGEYDDPNPNLYKMKPFGTEPYLAEEDKS